LKTHVLGHEAAALEDARLPGFHLDLGLHAEARRPPRARRHGRARAAGLLEGLLHLVVVLLD
jgi:hypothetical protein